MMLRLIKSSQKKKLPPFYSIKKVDLLYIIGLIPECMIHIAKKEFKNNYFEQGLFNKTIFDKKE